MGNKSQKRKKKRKILKRQRKQDIERGNIKEGRIGNQIRLKKEIKENNGITRTRETKE